MRLFGKQTRKKNTTNLQNEHKYSHEDQLKRDNPYHILERDIEVLPNFPPNNIDGINYVQENPLALLLDFYLDFEYIALNDENHHT